MRVLSIKLRTDGDMMSSLTLSTSDFGAAVSAEVVLLQHLPALQSASSFVTEMSVMVVHEAEK